MQVRDGDPDNPKAVNLLLAGQLYMSSGSAIDCTLTRPQEARSWPDRWSAAFL